MDFLKKFLSRFKKEKEEEILGTPLERLKKGDILELEGKTWEVTDVALYDYGSTKEREWEIRSADERGFLSLEEGKIYLFREIDPSSLKPEPGKYYREKGKPPEYVEYEGKKYNLKYAGKAKYVKGGESYPVVVWEFMNEEGEMIDVEIWDEYETEAFKGRELKEWEIEGVFPR